jgi:hypothetical protein
MEPTPIKDIHMEVEEVLEGIWPRTVAQLVRLLFVAAVFVKSVSDLAYDCY